MRKTFSKVTAILSIVFGSVASLLYLVYFVVLLVTGQDVFAVLCLALGSISVAQIISGEQLLRASKERMTGKLVAVLVFSALHLSVIIVAFAIVALCSKDSDASNSNVATAQNQILQCKPDVQVPIIELLTTVTRFHQYITDGVITKEVFEKKLIELVKKFVAENLA